MTVARARTIAKVLLMRQSPVPVDVIHILIAGGVDYAALEARHSV